MSDDYAELLHSWKVEEDEKLKDQTNGLKAVSNTTNVEPIQTREELYKSWEQEESAKGKASLDRAVTTNPDQYAETLSLSGKAGLPVDTVERNLDEIKNRERVKEIDYDSLAYKSPALAESLKDIEFGKVSHDQIENLSFLEDASKKLDPNTWFDRGDWLRNKSDAFNSAIAIAAGSSLSGTGTFLQIMKDENVDRDPIIENYKKSKMFGGMVGFGILGFAAEPLQKIGDTIKEFGQSIVPERMTYADQVVSGLGQLSTQAVTFAINPTAATGLMWGQGIDIQKDKIKEAGDLDHDYAEVEMLAGGAIIAVTEFLATKYHLGPSAKLGLKNKAYDVIATTLSSGAVEAVQETSESIIRDVTNILMTNPDGEIGIEQAFEEGGVAATVGFIFQTIISGGRYAKARKTQQAFENLSDAVKAQELRDRSPEAFNSFAERVAQNMADQTDGALTDVYIDSEIFNQIMNDAGIDRDFIIEQYPELKEQLEETDSTSGDLRLPMKDWIGSVAGTDIGDALMPHIRASESDLSVAELDIAESMRPSIEERFEEAKKEQTDNKAFKQSASAVRKSVYEQIKSTGVYSDSVSRQYASLMSNFFVTQARETGKTPQEMYDKYPIKIRREFDLNNRDDVTAVLNQAKTSGYEGNVAGEALEWVRAVEKGLDMSLEGRMARAAEMGFDVDQVFYHGTTEFGAIGIQKNGFNVEEYGGKGGNALGDGVYLTTSKQYAARYGSRHHKFTNNNKPEISSLVGKDKKIVVPVYIKSSAISNTGFDGKEVLVKDPSAIRSVNAAFDPDFRDSSNILAQGRADVSVAGGLSGKDKISVRDIEGATIFPIFADLTDSGTVFDSFGAIPIEPTELHGGPNFVNLKAYKDNGIVWAFDAKNKINGIVNKVNKLKEQGAERVIVTVMAMKEDSHLSNSMVASALLRTVNGLAKAGRIDDKALADATAHIRSKSVKKGDGYAELADFPGFEDRDGFSEWVDAATFTTRAAISRELLTPTFQKFLYFINADEEIEYVGQSAMARVTRELRDPEYSATQQSDALLAFEIDTSDENIIVDFDSQEAKDAGIPRHPSYKYGLRGKLLGSFGTHMPMDVLYQDLTKELVNRSEQTKEEAERNIVYLMSRLRTEDAQVVTPKVVEEAEMVEGIHDYRVAQAYSSALAGEWRDSDTDVGKGGVSPVEFEVAIKESLASITLTKYTAEEIKAGKKDGSFTVFQLGDKSVEKGGLSTWIGIKRGVNYSEEYEGPVTKKLIKDGILTDNEVALVGVVNNEVGVGGMGTYQVLKAIEEGATVLDAYKVISASKPDGLLPTIYATMGFQEVGQVPFDESYHTKESLAELKVVWESQGWVEGDPYPSISIMKYEGSENDRQNATARFISENTESSWNRGERFTEVYAKINVLRNQPDDVGRQDGGSGQDNGRADTRGVQDRARSVADRGRDFVESILRADELVLDALKIPKERVDKIRKSYPQADESGVFNQQAIPQTETNEFREWAGTDEIVESDEINDHDFSGDEPTVVRVYHATTHEFDTFDTSVKGNVEGHFGKVNYFTSSEYDAEQNYAGRGPDLTGRIESLKERLESQYESFEGSSDFDEIADIVNSEFEIDLQPLDIPTVDGELDGVVDIYELADMVSSRVLDGGESKVMEVFVKTNKPFVVRGRSRLEKPSSDDSPFMEFFDFDAIREQAVEQVAEDNDITVEEVLANEDDYLQEIYDNQYLQMEDGNPLIDAIQAVASEYDIDQDEILQALWEFARDGVDQNTLEAVLREESNLAYVTDEEGNLAANDFVARVIQELGYDSIILKDADAQFSNMGMEQGTTHVHVFDANNTNVKSATDNSGAFDPKDPNIYKQSKGGKFYSAVESAVAGMNIPGFKVSKKNPDGKARGSDVWAKLIKSGVKKEEYEWLGLEEFLTGNEGARFTRSEVVDFIKDNGVQVEINHLNRSEGGELSGYEDMIMEGDYSDYRDIQLTLPSIEEDFYYVEHFLQRNVLSFMRVTDREIDGRGKAYFIEELQSDWHQQGRKEGYKTGRDLDEINAEYQEAYEQWESNFDYSDYYPDGAKGGFILDSSIEAYLRDIFSTNQDSWSRLANEKNVGSPERTMIDAIISDLQSRENLPEIIAQYERVQDLFGQELTEEYGVPNAPFKGDSWLRLSLKKALVDAVESGAESFSWSSGEILKKRYERSGTTTLFETQYNKKMPSIVQSLTKQKPERVSNGNATNPEDVWVIPITDELKESIESEGFSLFQGTGGETRGGFDPKNLTVVLGKQSDYSTFVHEASHFFLEVYADLASNGDPKYQKDFNIILDWMGVDSIEAWNNMTLDQKRQYHEQFAYNYEIYTFEGNSPSVEMQTLFDKFSAWLRRVYESIRDELNAAYKLENGKDLPMLTGEIRQVMDRMLASEKQIEQAQLVRSAVPIFQTKEQSGMNDQEWEEYQVMAQEQNDAANSSLARSTARQIQWLENAKSKVIKGIQAKSRAARKLIKEEVTKQVKSERIYAAQQFMRYGDIGQEENVEPKKINSQMLKDMYEGVEDAPDLRGLGYGKGGMVGRDGIDPEIVAQIYGFESADQMIREILSSRKLKDEISARTDQRMLEEYSEFSDPKAIEDAVTKALHSEARAKFMAVELRHLMKSTQPYRVMQKAAQTAAQSILRGKKISDIRPKMYEAAESKAAKEVLLLMKKGDSEGAVAAKQRELLNHHLVKESTAMLESVDKAQAKFKRLLGKGAQKNMRGDFLEQLNALLERFDLRKSVSKAQMGERPPLRDFIQDQARKLSAVAPDIAAWILNSDSKQHYKTLTIDEFSDLVDAVDMLENMARREQKMYMAVRNMTFQQEREAILAELEEANPDTFEDGKPNRYVKHDKTARAERWWNNKSKFDGEFINFETLLDVATKGGGKSIFESLFNRLSQAADNKNEFMIHLGKQLKEVGAAYSARERYEFTRKKPIVTSTGRYMTRENRIAVALYYGSETGRQRLAEGNNFTDLEIKEIINSLDEKDVNLMKEMWRINDEIIWPKLRDLNKRTAGKAPEKVGALPFQTRFGVVQGGYVPIAYDSDLSVRQEELDLANSVDEMLGITDNGRAQTRQGSSKERLDVVKDPLDLTLTGMERKMNETIHDITHREAVVDTYRLLSDKNVATALKNAIGHGAYQAMTQAIREVAVKPKPLNSSSDKVVTYLRNSTLINLMGASVNTTLLNVLGVLPAMNRVGPLRFAKHLGKLHYMKRSEWIYEKSQYMKNRLTSYDRDLNEEHARMVGKNGYMPSMAFWFAGLSMMDRAVTIPTWAAAYEKGMEVYKNDEVAAVTYADRVVRQSQSAARPVDLAHVSSRQHLKIFTMFYGFFSSMLGTMRRTHAKAGKQMSDKEYAKATMALASAYLMNIILPAALEAIAKGKCGDDPDASDYLQCTLRSSTFFAAGFLPIVRDAMPFAYDMIIDDENYRSFGYSVTPIADTVEVGLRAFGEIKDIAEGDDVSLRTMVIGSGAIFGLPGVQTYRTLRGTEALLDGETDNPLAVLVGPPKK